jgi:hypothetical protein
MSGLGSPPALPSPSHASTVARIPRVRASVMPRKALGAQPTGRSRGSRTHNALLVSAPPPRCRDGSGAGPPPGALPDQLRGARTSGKREPSSPTVRASGAHGLSALGGPSVARGFACGHRRGAGDVTPRRLQAPPVGRSDAGDAPVTLTPPRCPAPRGRGARWRSPRRARWRRF